MKQDPPTEKSKFRRKRGLRLPPFFGFVFNSLFRHRILLSALATVLFFSWAGFHFGDRYGLLVGFFSAATLLSLVGLYVERRLKTLFSSTELEGVDPDGILRKVREASRRLGVRAPQVFVPDLETPTAFSAGLFERGTKLFLTRGLIERFTPEEVELVITYELERVKSEHTRSVTAMTAVASLIATVANAFDALLFIPFRKKRELRRYGPMTLLTSPLVAALVRLSSPRKRLMKLDEKIQAFSKTWARTLWKLDAYNKTLPLDVNLAEASLFTVNPLGRYSWCRFASVQPPIDSRMRHLIGRYPL